MAEENKVVLHGMWASPLAKRVEIALKLKGIDFEYVEEDLKNKSPALLHYNPVHKKVPVLVHNGKPIAESLVILEYIDETWKNSPPLLPQDPYRRAQIRFWVSFLHQQLIVKVNETIKAEGEAREEALKETMALMKLFEMGLKELLSEKTPFVNGNEIGLLEIAYLSLLWGYKAQEQVFGYKAIDEEETPLIFCWINGVIEHPIVKQFSLTHDQAVSFFEGFKERLALSSSSA